MKVLVSVELALRFTFYIVTFLLQFTVLTWFATRRIFACAESDNLISWAVMACIYCGF